MIKDTLTGRTAGRDAFASSLGAFTATVASAVGLGNIWKFPFLAGVNGGAAFVLAYLASVVLVGLPILAAEHAIGRRMRADAVTSYSTAKPGEPAWGAVGVSGIVTAVLIMAFYTDVAGWVFAYIPKSIGAAFAGTGPLGPEAFAALSSGAVEPLLWQAGVIVFVAAIVAGGVSGGIEKATKLTMPILLVLLVVCDVRALTLPGAFAGVEFLFKPDVSKLTGAVMLSALGLAFFKLSLGMGTMTTYGSYMPDSTRIVPNAAKVALADTLVSILAGLAVFPAVFAFGFEPAAGPSLLFISIPAVFSRMPFGAAFTAVFFSLAALAATGAMISLFEVPVAWLSAKRKLGRPAASALTAVAIFALGSLATLSLGPLSGIKVAGLNFFDLFDHLQERFLMPLGGLAIAVFAGWRLSKDDVLGELSKGYGADGAGKASARLAYAFMKFVSPALILIVFLNGFGVFGK